MIRNQNQAKGVTTTPPPLHPSPQERGSATTHPSGRASPSGEDSVIRAPGSVRDRDQDDPGRSRHRPAAECAPEYGPSLPPRRLAAAADDARSGGPAGGPPSGGYGRGARQGDEDRPGAREPGRVSQRI